LPKLSVDMFKESKEDLRIEVLKVSLKKFLRTSFAMDLSTIFQDQRQNRKLLVNYEETTLSQNQRRQIMCEKKLRDPQRHRMIIYTNVNKANTTVASGFEDFLSSDQESDSFLSDAPLNCPATLADEEEKNNRHRDSHNVNEKVTILTNNSLTMDN
ncbi:hypothetical protein GLOIN_2v1558309, partial [Rhizophagus irregularis DAOM 181602=DAOM 197198]